MKNLLLASTSTLHGEEYLEYLLPQIKNLFSDSGEIIFVPYARPGGISHEEYTSKAQKPFSEVNLKIRGLHTFPDPKTAISKAEGIFTGGGNTFLLVQKLYQQELLLPLTEALNTGTPYLGTSAGTNIAGLTMNTTNDMPIVYPPSFKTLGIVPFNINPHYLDPDPASTHKGETRETRIKEFHKFNSQPVVGLREGSWLEVNTNGITLKGGKSARIFLAEKLPFELENNQSLNDLY